VALQLVEQQVNELQKLTENAQSKELNRLRAAIEELLQSTDAGHRFEAELHVEKIGHKKPGAIKALSAAAEKLALTTKEEDAKWARIIPPGNPFQILLYSLYRCLHGQVCSVHCHKLVEFNVRRGEY
tara:strand:- start:197 stop:577 length:381 start_codon:yes stop_codon:yes gene_type:complete